MEKNQYIDIILDESGRLERLVREVRDFSDIQSATLQPDYIEPAIDEVFQIFEPLAGNRQVKNPAHRAGLLLKKKPL